MLSNLIKESLENDNELYENRVILNDLNLGVKLIVSGTTNSDLKGNLEITNLPNFSDEKGYSNVNGINRNGKNIVFYKLRNMNTITDQLKKSRNKTPEGMPYVVCIDISGPRFSIDESSDHVTCHFERGDFKTISGVLLVLHGVSYSGDYCAELKYISNPNSVSTLKFLENFFVQQLSVNINSRY